MLTVTGISTTIVQRYLMIKPDIVARIRAWPSLSMPDCAFDIPRADRYILAAGVLYQKPLAMQTGAEIAASMCVNYINVVRICESIFQVNEEARVCVVGSESGYVGSFDETYAGAKAAVHCYVENRKMLKTQQLVCVAPSIISDSGMTERRKDYPEILGTRKTVTAMQVAEIIFNLLHGDILVNNTVIRMRGTKA